MHDQTLTLTLDDGSVWEFEGDGYDTSQLIITLKHPASNVPANA